MNDREEQLRDGDIRVRICSLPEGARVNVRPVEPETLAEPDEEAREHWSDNVDPR